MSNLILDLEGDEPGSIGRHLSDLTGWALAPLEWRRFEDGEFKLRPMCELRGHRVVVVARAASSTVHERLIALGLLLSTLHRQAPAEVHVVLPCLPYARKDRRTQPRDPLSLQWMARMLSIDEPSAVWTFEPHEPAAAENAFGCPLHALSMADWVAQSLREATAGAWAGPAVDVVASPDAGGVRRALAVRTQLSLMTGASFGFALMDKHREADVLSGDPRIVGDVLGLKVLVVDDLVVSGASLERMVRALRQAGALEVHALLAHGRPTAALRERLGQAGLSTMILSDSMASPTDAGAVDDSPLVGGIAISGRDARPGQTGSTAALHCRVRSMVPLLARRLRSALTDPA